MKQLLWHASSLFLLIACSWFAIMELLIHRPRSAMPAIIALLIVQYTLVCLRYAYSNSYAARQDPILGFCAVVTLTLGILAIWLDLRSAHFEGYVLLISAGLIAHSLLTFANVLTRPRLNLHFPPN